MARPQPSADDIPTPKCVSVPYWVAKECALQGWKPSFVYMEGFHMLKVKGDVHARLRAVEAELAAYKLKVKNHNLAKW